MTTFLAEPRQADASVCAQVHCLGTRWHAEHPTDCSLVPFLNRPFLHHVVDRLNERGIQSIKFICRPGTAEFQDCLGDGSRWGADFHYFAPAAYAEYSRTSSTFDAVSVASHALPPADARQESVGLLRVDSPQSFLESQLTVMQCGFESLLTVETEIAPAIWAARNVRIHPSAKIEGPILLGENVRVGPGVIIGPGSVIGSGCVLGRNSCITKSTIMPNLFLGEGLRVSRSIVFDSRIYNVRLGTSIAIHDRLLVSRIA